VSLNKARRAEKVFLIAISYSTSNSYKRAATYRSQSYTARSQFHRTRDNANIGSFFRHCFTRST